MTPIATLWNALYQGTWATKNGNSNPCRRQRRTSWASLLILAFVTLSSAGYTAAAEPVSKSRLSGVAIGGHDATAYHSLSREPQATAVEGKKAYVVEFKGAKWRFLSKESSERFAAEPQKFSPAYNGHCANALSLGEGLVRTDGTHWEIFNDQLYLFYAPRGRNRWLDGNWETYKQDADAAWGKLSQ